MFLEVLDAALNLDLSWFAWLVMANIHWIFMLTALAVLYLGKKKRIVLSVIIFTLLLYVLGDIVHVGLGWHLPAIVLFMVFIEKLSVEQFQNVGFVKRNGLLIAIVFFFLFVAIANGF